MKEKRYGLREGSKKIIAVIATEVGNAMRKSEKEGRQSMGEGEGK